MLKIRLSRTGKKNAPSYRIVVIPEKYSRDGKALEVLGYFNPSIKPPAFSINKERLKYWLSQGAQMTETVRKLSEGKYEFKAYRPKVVQQPEKKGSEEEAVTSETRKSKSRQAEEDRSRST